MRKKSISLLVLIPGLFLFSSCVHQFKLINPADGTTITGTYNKIGKTVEVILPSGERLRGNYVALTNASISYSSLFYGANVGRMLSMGIGGVSNGYAFLIGDQKTVMEIIFSYSELTGHGFGIAKTNKGGEYRVMF